MSGRIDGTVSGLVVAGGEGRRMLESGITEPKPLVEVAGATLLERNLATLLAAGIADITVASAASTASVGRFVETRCRPAVARLGGRLRLVEEDPPLGSIGAVGLVDDSEHVVVVNADNVTTLDLPSVIAHHVRAGADTTIAVHDHSFTMPFGHVTLDGTQVVAYDEKPTVRFRVSSAVTVVGPAGMARLRPARFAMLPAFANELLADGGRLEAFVHDARWIDVNDHEAKLHADALVAADPEAFPTFTSLLAGGVRP